VTSVGNRIENVVANVIIRAVGAQWYGDEEQASSSTPQA
jgi:hypothetical protein